MIIYFYVLKCYWGFFIYVIFNCEIIIKVNWYVDNYISVFWEAYNCLLGVKVCEGIRNFRVFYLEVLVSLRFFMWGREDLFIC